MIGSGRLNANNYEGRPPGYFFEIMVSIDMILQSVGALVLTVWSLKFLSTVYKTFFRSGKDLRKYGKWAVITGATDGIGKAYAMEMARKGLNILLISRTQSKLDAVSEEIETKYNKIETRTLAIDYSSFDEAARKKVETAIDAMEVGVLVNNVGMSYSHPSFFTELSSEEISQLIELNVASTTWMTRLVLPGMEERGRGAILNISSGAGHFASPLLSQYSAVKGYIEMFSRSLNAEYGPKGVHVQCQAPMLITSKLSKIRTASISVPSPQTYARVGAAAIGYEAFTSPFWAHGVQLWAIDLLPSSIISKVVGNMHLGLRRKALRKKSQKTE